MIYMPWDCKGIHRIQEGSFQWQICTIAVCSSSSAISISGFNADPFPHPTYFTPEQTKHTIPNTGIQLQLLMPSRTRSTQSHNSRPDNLRLLRPLRPLLRHQPTRLGR